MPIQSLIDNPKIQELYNSEYKEQFFRHLHDRGQLSTIIFGAIVRISALEQYYDKDIFLLRPDQVKEAANLMGEYGASKVWYILHIADQYGQWVESVGKTANYSRLTDVIDPIELDLFENFRRSILPEPENLASLIHTVCDSYITNGAVLATLTWAGLPTSLSDLKTSAFSDNFTRVQYKSTEHNIHPVLAEILAQYNDESGSFLIGDTAGGKKIRKYKSSSPYFLKSFSTSVNLIRDGQQATAPSLGSAASLFYECCREYGKSVSANSISMSGTLYRVYNVAKTAGVNPIDILYNLDLGGYKPTKKTVEADWRNYCALRERG